MCLTKWLRLIHFNDLFESWHSIFLLFCVSLNNEFGNGLFGLQIYDIYRYMLKLSVFTNFAYLGIFLLKKNRNKNQIYYILRYSVKIVLSTHTNSFPFTWHVPIYIIFFIKNISGGLLSFWKRIGLHSNRKGRRSRWFSSSCDMTHSTRYRLKTCNFYDFV
jgi:hypothetical protein